MQPGGDLTEVLGHLEVAVDQLGDLGRRHYLVGVGEWLPRHSAIGEFIEPAQQLLVKPAEGVGEDRPGVALVGDVSLQDGQRCRVFTPVAVLECTRHRGEVGERGAFGEKAANLEIGVDAPAHPAEHLEDPLIGIGDRAVSFGGLGDGDLAVGEMRPGPEGAGLRGEHRSRLSRQAALAPDRGQQLPGEAGVPGGVVEQALTGGVTHPHHHCLGMFGLDASRVGAAGQAERHQIGLRLAVQVVHPEERQAGAFWAAFGGHHVEQVDRSDIAVATDVPHPGGKVRGEQPFQPRPSRATENVAGWSGHLDDLHRLGPCRNGDLLPRRFQTQPEEIVGSQGERIAGVADRGEENASQ